MSEITPGGIEAIGQVTPGNDRQGWEITAGKRPKVLLLCEVVRLRYNPLGYGRERLIIGPWMGAASPRWLPEESVIPLGDLREVLQELIAYVDEAGAGEYGYRDPKSLALINEGARLLSQLGEGA